MGGWKQLLQSVSGGPVSVPMTIVISGIAKMLLGSLWRWVLLAIHKPWNVLSALAIFRISYSAHIVIY